jgi:hypothetical protein
MTGYQQLCGHTKPRSAARGEQACKKEEIYKADSSPHLANLLIPSVKLLLDAVKIIFDPV